MTGRLYHTYAELDTLTWKAEIGAVSLGLSMNWLRVLIAPSGKICKGELREMALQQLGEP